MRTTIQWHVRQQYSVSGIHLSVQCHDTRVTLIHDDGTTQPESFQEAAYLLLNSLEFEFPTFQTK